MWVAFAPPDRKRGATMVGLLEKEEGEGAKGRR